MAKTKEDRRTREQLGRKQVFMSAPVELKEAMMLAGDDVAWRMVERADYLIQFENMPKREAFQTAHREFIGVVIELKEGRVPAWPKTLRDIESATKEGITTLLEKVKAEKVAATPGSFDLKTLPESQDLAASMVWAVQANAAKLPLESAPDRMAYAILHHMQTADGGEKLVMETFLKKIQASTEDKREWDTGERDISRTEALLEKIGELDENSVYPSSSEGVDEELDLSEGNLSESE